MNEKEKDMLIKDICARIPYNVIGKCELDASYDTSFDTVFQTHKFNAEVYGIKEDLLLVTPLIEDNDEQTYAEEEVADGVSILDFTPYLFPMSSMTEEQSKEYHELIGGMFGTSALINFEVFTDFFNSNHLDYRGLIPMQLSIDATGLNIY